MPTFGDIRDEVVNRMGRGLDSSLQTRAEKAVLSAYRKAFYLPWEELTQEVDIAVTANQNELALPKHTMAVHAVWIPASYEELHGIRNFDQLYPGVANVTGQPRMYDYIGKRPYRTTWHTAAEQLNLEIKSGGNPRTVTLTGLVSDSDAAEVEGDNLRFVRETVSCTGGATVTTAYSYDTLKSMSSKPADAVSRIYLTGVTSGNNYGVLDAQSDRLSYPWLRFAPLASGAYTLRIKVTQSPPEELARFDVDAVPLIPIEEYLQDAAWGQLLLEERRRSEGMAVRREAQALLQQIFYASFGVAPVTHINPPLKLDDGEY